MIFLRVTQLSATIPEGRPQGHWHGARFVDIREVWSPGQGIGLPWHLCSRIPRKKTVAELEFTKQRRKNILWIPQKCCPFQFHYKQNNLNFIMCSIQVHSFFFKSTLCNLLLYKREFFVKGTTKRAFSCNLKVPWNIALYGLRLQFIWINYCPRGRGDGSLLGGGISVHPCANVWEVPRFNPPK